MLVRLDADEVALALDELDLDAAQLDAFYDALDEEQIERLQVIAAKCPVHRTLEGEVMFDEKLELV